MRIVKTLDEVADDNDRVWLDESFEHMLQLKLWKAYKEARRGKRATEDEQKFEVNADENLRLLRKDIMNKTYEPSRSTAHIIHNPVKREIFAAPFRDRSVHHLMYDEIYEICDNRFIYDSYSCREGKGTLFGIKRLDYHIRSASRNYADKVYIAKFDLSGYFMSLPREDLYAEVLKILEIMLKKTGDKDTYEMMKFLWHQVIFDDPVDGVVRKGKLSDWNSLPPEKSLFNQMPGVGIVIGNLTSQLLSNIYLDQLDRFVVYGLGYKHYGRYVDDFYIVVTADKLEQLKRDVLAIEEFLKSIKLTLHPRKRVILTPEMGVPFLGAMVHKGYILPGKRLRRNFREACKMVQAGEKDITTLISYMGHVKHFDKIKFLSKELDRIGCDYYY